MENKTLAEVKDNLRRTEEKLKIAREFNQNLGVEMNLMEGTEQERIYTLWRNNAQRILEIEKNVAEKKARVNLLERALAETE